MTTTTTSPEAEAALVTWCRERTGHHFSNPTLLQLALLHRSAGSTNNERLEFLGDAVLDTVISSRLLALLPDASEGELSRQRAALVREPSLAELARSLDLADKISLGAGERKSGGHRRSSILADAFEALLGAVFEDGGYAAAERVIERLYAQRLATLPSDQSLKDPKTRLQEWLQKHGDALPVYTVTDISGEAHKQVFTVSCEVAAHAVRVSATGSSRRKAEQAAATVALAKIQ